MLHSKHKPKSRSLAASSALLLSTGICSGVAQSAVAEVSSSVDDQKSVAVTIYNENLALVKDQRQVDLNKGEQDLAFKGVSAQMRPETALLRSSSGSGKFKIIEQNFDFDLLTPQKLLEKYTGQEIRIARMNPATGKETTEDATVLSTQNGVVLRIGDRIETNPGGRLIFADVPDNLRDQPTLSIKLDSASAGEKNVELSYLTGGLSWKADYVAELNSSDSALDLMGWVTLNNNSGASYNNAKMQLVAGDVNQVSRFEEVMVTAQRSRKMDMMSAEADMSQESLFEYHLYTLNRPTTISDRQKKQVSLLTASSVPVKKELLLQGNNYYYHSSHGNIGQKMKLGVYVQFDNEKKDGLGVPLPKGVVRVYKRDTKGNAQFVGEDRIDHTANKENVRLKLGDSFDVTADKKQTNFKIVERIVGRNVYDSSYSIKLKNAKKESVTVIVREPVPGDWQMLKESLKHTKRAAGTAEWKVTVPAESSSTLTYTVRTKF